MSGSSRSRGSSASTSSICQRPGRRSRCRPKSRLLDTTPQTHWNAWASTGAESTRRPRGHTMRAFAAVPIAVVVCIATPAFADAHSHVSSARKAERRGEWKKALQQWKAAYAADGNAESLIGIGDAYAHLGKKAEARKSYEAYLADPLALPANVDKVKAKIAQLAPPPAGSALALPLPGATSAPPPLSGAPNSAPKAATALVLPLPAKSTPPPGLDLPAPKKDADNVAALAPPPLPLSGVAQPAPKKDAVPAVATNAEKPAKPIALTTPAAQSPSAAPVAAVTAASLPRQPQASSGVQRTMAYVTGGVAIAALGGGALAFTKANSAHDELTSGVHSGADAQRLLGDEQRNKTLSMVGLAGGVLPARIYEAPFVFYAFPR